MDKTKKNLLVFGYGLGVILTFFSTRLWIKYGPNGKSYVFVCLALIFVLITIFRLDVLKVIYNRWMKVAGFIGHHVSLVLLIIIFYVVFGIPGLVLRLLRKDLLNQEWDLKQTSYWIKKQKTEFSQENYRRQF